MKYHPRHYCMMLSLLAPAGLAFAGGGGGGNLTAGGSSSGKESGFSASGADLIEWIANSRNGFVNTKQELRGEEGDRSSSLGFFATDDIYMGELLASIPWKNIVSAGPGWDHTSPVALNCRTVRNLAREMRKGNESRYAPYVLYLLAQRRGQLPSAWSEPGRDLLEMLGNYNTLPPESPAGWIEWDWHHECRGSDDPLDEHAALLVVQRAEDDLMVPVYDMYNHRNGRWHNALTRVERGVRFDVIAARDIKAGEQIYTSYNDCVGCEGRGLAYGTPDILRDYGFVENYPQRWVFYEQETSFELDQNEDSDRLFVRWHKAPSRRAVHFFRDELHRLRTFGLTDMQVDNDTSPDGEIPQFEMGLIREYHEAITSALAHAIKAADERDEDTCVNGVDGECRPVRYVHNMFSDDTEEGNDWAGQMRCRNRHTQHDGTWQYMSFDERGYEDVYAKQSLYQMITFMEYQPTEPHTMCLDLDNTIQTCTTFRPHYHDYMVHFHARYIESLRRVAFIGGGDSMLLHEILKYPDIELVIGLELDQIVTRHSFKELHTQPHFDDERVEWWFGDATKSLRVLPKEYFGSFDLVMVDLSETVMSFPVTKKLNILGALALLVKPDGIFVKNEMYMEPMSELFDYSAQLLVTNVPEICDQPFVMGSNKVDFLNPKVLKDHNVEMLLLPKMENQRDHIEMLRDYRKNDARAQGKCTEVKGSTDDTDEEELNAGILLVLEAENVTGELDSMEQVGNAMFSALKGEGLSPLSIVTNPSEEYASVIIITMEEGYIEAHVWPEHKYCAIDIHLWGAFRRQESARDALLGVVGGSMESTSSYRVAVGGMGGASTWSEDKEITGPRITQNRDCEDKADQAEGEVIDDKKAIDVVTKEVLNLVPNKEGTVAVLCGGKDESCESLDAIRGDGNVMKVVPLWTCPPLLTGVKGVKSVENLFDCENNTMSTLKDSGMLSAFIVDPSAPFKMVRIAQKIWGSTRNQKKLLMPESVFLSVMLDETEEWRRHFLDSRRKELIYPPVNRAEVILSGTGRSVEVGLVSTGDSGFFGHLIDLSSSIQERTGFDATIRRIHGEPWRERLDWEPISFLPEDYDQRPAQEQYEKQQPLGFQSISQLEVEVDNDKWQCPANDTKEQSIFEESAKGDVSVDQLESALQRALSQMELEHSQPKVFNGVGDGAVLVSFLSEGSVTVVWDGHRRIDVNIFGHVEDDKYTNKLLSTFKTHMKRTKTTQFDEQPRGIGRVINFKKDIFPSSYASGWSEALEKNMGEQELFL